MDSTEARKAPTVLAYASPFLWELLGLTLTDLTSLATVNGLPVPQLLVTELSRSTLIHTDCRRVVVEVGPLTVNLLWKRCWMGQDELDLSRYPALAELLWALADAYPEPLQEVRFETVINQGDELGHIGLKSRVQRLRALLDTPAPPGRSFIVYCDRNSYMLVDPFE